MLKIPVEQLDRGDNGGKTTVSPVSGALSSIRRRTAETHTPPPRFSEIFNALSRKRSSAEKPPGSLSRWNFPSPPDDGAVGGGGGRPAA